MNFIDKRPIGLFDSGVGGLSVLKKMREILPDENFIYIADTNRVPYGLKTPEEIVAYTFESFKIMEKQNVKAAIIACNTATSYALETIQKHFQFPIIGVIEPAVEDTIKATSNKKVLLWATDATVKSDIYSKKIQNLNDKIKLKSQACIKLVAAVESGHADDDICYDICSEYIKKYSDFNYDTLILGCTHFPLAEPTIRIILRQFKKDVKLVNPAYSTARNMKKLLTEKNILNNSGNAEVKFIISGGEEKFRFVAADVLNMRYDELNINTFYNRVGDK